MTINNYNNSEDYDNFDTSLNDGLTFSSLHHFFTRVAQGGIHQSSILRTDFSLSELYN
jgi:hypothetical protein